MATDSPTQPTSKRRTKTKKPSKKAVKRTVAMQSAIEFAPPPTAPTEPQLDQAELLAALRAVKRGDFSVRLPEGLTGRDGQIANTFNDIVELQETNARELTELCEAVGKRGRTKRRIARGGRRGAWAQKIDAVNELVDDMSAHMLEISRVVAAVSEGDLTQTIELGGSGGEPLDGEFARQAKIVNAMVVKLDEFGSEVSRVAREVGIEGKLGAQAKLRGLGGTWKELADNVNVMAENLTDQVRDIAKVTTAVARGDLSQKISVDVKGEILELKDTINTMVDQLSSFSAEVTRVARQVGTEGILGGRAEVRGVSGTWQELTENVNSMADNLTSQVRNIATVTTAVANGDLSKKITVTVRGEMLELKDTINTMVDQLGSFAAEVTRVAREVGTEGVLGGQAEVRGVSGTWRELTENVNSMADNLTAQVRNIATVTTAVANGDLTRKITVEAQGEILELKDTINSMVDRLQSFSTEVTRVARLVGTEGTLGVQAEVQDVSGVWKDLTDNVNGMATNLTDQVRGIAEVTTAVANGDLSQKITVEVRGELLQLKNTINQMVDSLNAFASEVTRVAREVGIEGVLGGQATVRDVSGVWAELTDSVNHMADNLTNQVRNIAEVASAVAAGDLSRKINVAARGEISELKETINTMVDQLNAFGAEVTQLARDVGVEGRLGGQAKVAGVRGLWRELTENVNLMAGNLTDQVRDIATVTTAVAKGDLTCKINVDAKGEILDLKTTINTMVDQLTSFAQQVTRVAREVGVEGQLGGQADVRGVEGTWRELTDNVNLMANNLTNQVRNIAQVASSIATGDLTKTIVVDARGEILELKNTINTMVGQLSAFGVEVTRVAREVGTEGRLGGQADVRGVSGTWRELTDNVNLMADNLTNQVRDIALVTTAVARGDLGKYVSVEVRGEMLELKTTINTMVDQLASFSSEVTRVARDVGVEGRLGGQADVRGVEGTWRELTDNVNLMATNLTDQVRDIAQVTTAVAQGDLSRKITVEVRGELAELTTTINTMVDQLGAFGDEVTRVAREVGTDGVLGGQADVPGAGGIWQDLTNNVNTMARNLTEQVRGIARVVTAVASGDLQQKLQLEARGEISTLATTINDMSDTLSIFAEQVTGVAHSVGVEGRLGDQADVPGAEGLWRDLTNNVNELARNLTTQVRAIGDVATAVTKGDLTQTITVDASGEVAELKDNLNQMITSLAETTRVNRDQDWLKTNLTRFTRMLQGQRDLQTVAQQVLSELAGVLEIQHGAFYLMQPTEDEDVQVLKLYSSYAYRERKHVANEFRPGEGVVGQCAFERSRILLRAVPDDYIKVQSGLGEASPTELVAVPIIFEDSAKGVIELAGFKPFTDIQLDFLDQLVESLGIVVASIEAQMRTDQLLGQSQSLAQELQSQQEELQQTNEELEEKARELTHQKSEVETKNREVEEAKATLEERAEQIAMASKYKSQFLANMSHELRTPLNSLLILSKKLGDNLEDNLNPKQVEYAQTIHGAGTDLLGLINEVLDLAKVESGTLDLEYGEIHVAGLVDDARRNFSQQARDKGLSFDQNVDPDTPEVLVSDPKRLQQILRNLLSNAFKFTESGGVELRVYGPKSREWRGERGLSINEGVIAISVTDTGIGIPLEQQRVIFEAFQQAEGGTARKFGGTGLGLSISRELAELLGGEIVLRSEVGQGSTFTLYLPLRAQARTPLPPSNPLGTSRLTNQQPVRVNTLSEDAPAPRIPEEKPLPAPSIADDRQAIAPGDRVLLIIEDDDKFARVMLDQARESGFKVVVAHNGVDGLELARSLKPDAITLDLQLPDVHGWVVLDRLKHDNDLRHIPIHVMSVEPASQRSRLYGAFAFLQKPATEDALNSALERISGFVDNRVRNLLIVEDDDVQRESIIELIGNNDVHSTGVGSGEEALEHLAHTRFDCMVLDLRLPGMSGFELIGKVKQDSSQAHLPIVIYTGKELEQNEAEELERLAQSVIVKDAKSPERLLDETALFLHRVEANLPERKRAMLRTVHQSDPALAGKRVLIVDDDVRNVFALTSVLEQHNVEVLRAENGRDALAQLERETSESREVDAVIMDIMMPEMDGYEATRRIRQRDGWQALPVIALTAKAMKGDREACIRAGASDYITKPVDTDQLLSLLRVWMYQ